MHVRPVQDGRDLRGFVDLPFRLHGTDPHWVPPLRSALRRQLDPARDPFFDHAEMTLFLARDGDRVVGRIAAIQNRLHNEVHGDRLGFWGFFECERRPEVARALFVAAAEELGQRGLQAFRGPMNPSINSECGLLVEGFDRPPAVLMPYNPPWYEELVIAAGQRPLKDLLAYRLLAGEASVERPAVARLYRLADAAGRRFPQVTLRAIDSRRFLEEARQLNALFNQAREGNWGFVPVTPAEFEATARDMKAVLDPALVVIAEMDQKIVGCLLSIPDINPLLARCRGSLWPLGWWHLLRGRRRMKGIRVFGAATLPEVRTLGIAPMLFDRLVKNGRAHGYESAELSWVAEDNLKSRKTIESAFDIQPCKRYRVYEAAIGPDS